jgi:hypothetical protein
VSACAFAGGSVLDGQPFNIAKVSDFRVLAQDFFDDH